MDTKSKSFSYSTFVKLMAYILLTAMIFIFISTSIYFTSYSHYISSDYFYETRFFREDVEMMLDYIVNDDREALSRYSSTIKYTAYDKNQKILRPLSNQERAIDDIKGTDYAFLFERNNKGEVIKSVPLKSRLWRESQSFSHRSFHGFPFAKFKEKKIDKLLITFDYTIDKGVIGTNYQNFLNFKSTQNQFTQVWVGSFIIGVILGIYLLIVTGQEHKRDEVYLNRLDYIPTEIIVALMTMLLGVLIQMPFNTSQFGLDTSKYNPDVFLRVLTIELVFASFCVTVIILLGFIMLLSLTRSFKARQFMSRFIVYKIIKWLGHVFSIKRWMHTFKPIFIIYFLAYGLMNFIGALSLFAYYQDFPKLVILFILFVLNALAVNWLIKHLGALNLLIAYTNDSVHKDSVASLDDKKIMPIFKHFAQDIQLLKSGLGVAIDNAVKNERMRSELITNVTHDLKNPLTSIISYADLAQKEEVDNENAKQYIDVIYEKSNRLKVLIDHLVEASKVSSGISEIELKDVDLVALSRQVEGEYHEAFEEKKLNFIIQTTLEKAIIKTDTSYYTRILDNLFSNVLKYAMPNTRVYCSIDKEKNGYAVCIKNISNQPLDVSVDELTERFVRGQASRSTEGNGLGLGIAKSLALALGLELSIHIDGDLFKACIIHTVSEDVSSSSSDAPL